MVEQPTDNEQRRQIVAACLAAAGYIVSGIGRTAGFAIKTEEDLKRWQYGAAISEAFMLLMLAIALQPFLKARWTHLFGQWAVMQSIVNLACRVFNRSGHFIPFEYLITMCLLFVYRRYWLRDRKNPEP